MRRWSASLGPILAITLFAQGISLAPGIAFGQTSTCAGTFQSVSLPLNDLGAGEYVRMDGAPTGEFGGLYPNGSNVRPPLHDAAGVDIANQIVPLDALGNPDPVDGKIVFISIGMSNTFQEFGQFTAEAAVDPTINPNVLVLNTAIPGKTAIEWAYPDAQPWEDVDTMLAQAGVTPEQVQVAWVKQANRLPPLAPDFPERAEDLQRALEDIARSLKTNLPNTKVAFYSSRTRAYAYWSGLNPEPIAFETGFAVKWMLEKQIAGDPALNYDSTKGAVVAPFLAWGPYLWIDGLNPRSDGMIWEPADLANDCIHPSENGKQKVTDLLMAFFKNDSMARPWFVGDGLNPVADAAVEANAPDANNGDQPWLSVDDSPKARSYLRFDVGGLSEPVTSAELELFVDAGTVPFGIYAVEDNSWSESGITYNNAPAVSAFITQTQAISPTGYVYLDVTAVINGDGLYSFALLAEGVGGALFSSREGDHAPQLFVGTSKSLAEQVIYLPVLMRE